MPDIMVGSVAVGIVPSAQGFPEKLRAQLVPSAGKIGGEVGRSVSAGITESIGMPLSAWSDRQAAQAPAQGAKVGRSFAEGFRKSVEEVLAKLPPARITANATQAEREVQKIRAELTSLSTKVIGVDLTDKQALVKLDELKVKMREVGAQAPVAVRANIDQAIARIEEFRSIASKPVMVPVKAVGVPEAAAKMKTEMTVAGDVAGAGFGTRFSNKVSGMGAGVSGIGKKIGEGVGAAGGATAGASFVSKFAGGMKGAVSTLSGPWGKVIAGVIAIGAFSVIEGLKVPMATLKITLKDAGTSLDAVNPKLEKADSKMAGLGFSTSEVYQSVITLTRATHDANSAIGAQGMIADLARAKNISLATASDQIAKAANGNARALKGLGIVQITGATGAKAMATAQTSLADQVKQAGGMAQFASAHHMSLSKATDLVNKATKGSIPAFNKLGIEIMPKTATAAQNLAQLQTILGNTMGGTAQAKAETFGGKMQAIKTKFLDMAENLGMKLLPVLSKFATAILNMIGTISHWVGVVGKMVMPGVKIFLEGLKTVFEVLKPILKPLALGILAVATAFGILWLASGIGIVAAIIIGIVALIGVISHFRKQIVDAIKAVGDWIMSFKPVRDTVHAIEDGFKKLLGPLKDFWHSITDAFSFGKSGGTGSKAVGIMSKLKDAFNVIKTVVKVAFAIVKVEFDIISKVILGLLKNFNKFNVFKNVFKLLGDAIKIVGAIIGTIVDILTGKWGKAWNNILKIGKLLGDMFKTALSLIGGLIASWAATVWGIVGKYFMSAVVTPLHHAWSEMVNFFTGTIPGWFKSVYNWFIKEAAKIENWFTSLPGKVWGWISGIWNKVYSWFSTEAKKVADFYIGLPGKVWGWISGIWSKVYTWFMGEAEKLHTWFANLPGKVWGWISGIWNKVYTWFNDEAEKIHNWFASLPGKVGGWVSGLWKSLWTDFNSDVVTPIVNFFKGIPGMIADGLKGIGGVIKGALTSIPGIGGLLKHLPGFGSHGGLVIAMQHGGMIPGYAPGVDSVHTVLSPGEYVIVPEAVRALGAKHFADINAKYDKRSKAAVKGGVLGYASGGLVAGGAVASVAITGASPEKLKKQSLDAAKATAKAWSDSGKTWFVTAQAGFKKQVTDPVNSVVTKDIPGAFAKTVPNWYSAHAATLKKNVAEPATTLINNTIPAAQNKAVATWYNVHQATLQKNVTTPLTTLVNSTVPGMQNKTIPNWYNTHQATLNKQVSTPINTLITTTVPAGWKSSIAKWFPTVAPTHATQVAAPLDTFYKTTLPTNIVSGFGGAMKSVGATANKDIGQLNAVTKVGGISPIGALSFSRGGVMPGYEPGVDTMSIMVGGGEGILVPEAVVGIGGPGAIHALNRQFAGHRGAGYADGGIAGGDVAAYAKTVKNLYTWGGAAPPRTDCSGFSAAVYEHFGLVPAKPGTRWGTSQSQYVDPLLVSAGDQPGAMVFFGNPPTHVGISLGGGKYVGADGPEGADNRIEGEGGNSGWRVPKKGWVGGVGGILGDLVAAMIKTEPFGKATADKAGGAAKLVAAGGKPVSGALVNASGYGYARGGTVPNVLDELVLHQVRASTEKSVDSKVKAEAAALAALTSGGDAGVAGAATSGVKQWDPLILQALKMLGQPASLLGLVERQMQSESNGNAAAINNWDINAKNGDPSKGLMQVIGATFAAYHVAGTSNNIFDPLANIAAAINYAIHGRGIGTAAGQLGGGSGYKRGGVVPRFTKGGIAPRFAKGGSVWRYPAPKGLAASNASRTGYRLNWDEVFGPSGQKPNDYTVATYQLNGKKVDQFMSASRATAEYGYGGTGLTPGWQYNTLVWANGGPAAPAHAIVKATLKKAPAVAVPDTLSVDTSAADTSATDAGSADTSGGATDPTQAPGYGGNLGGIFTGTMPVASFGYSSGSGSGAFAAASGAGAYSGQSAASLSALLGGGRSASPSAVGGTGDRGRGKGTSYDFTRLERKLDALCAVTSRVGGDVGSTINGAARQAGNRSQYRTR